MGTVSMCLKGRLVAVAMPEPEVIIIMDFCHMLFYALLFVTFRTKR